MQETRGERRGGGGRREIRLLVLAGSGVLVLTALTGLLQGSAARDARAEVRALVARADESTRLVGRLGREAGRGRASVLELLTEADRILDGEDLESEKKAARNALIRFDRTIAESFEALERHGPLDSEVERWNQMRPALTRFQMTLRLALDDIVDGRPEAAEEKLNDAARESAELQGMIDALADANEKDSQELIATADEKLAELNRTALLAMALLLVSIAAILAVIVRTLQRRHAEVAHYVDRLEQVNRDLDAFAGRVAHDLRGAIAPMSMGAELLEQSSSPEAIEAVTESLRSGSRSAQVILEGLLAFSRAGSPDPEARASVRDACEEVEDELLPQAKRIGASLEIQAEDAEVPLSPGLLHVVIANVVANALKFVDGRERREVRLTTRKAEATCVIEVEDTGPGIPEESLGRIFEPFYRVPGSSADGVGIGLATVHRVVTSHHGSIEIRSGEGEGTQIKISLPRAVASGRPLPGRRSAVEHMPS